MQFWGAVYVIRDTDKWGNAHPEWGNARYGWEKAIVLEIVVIKPQRRNTTAASRSFKIKREMPTTKYFL